MQLISQVNTLGYSSALADPDAALAILSYFIS